MARNLLRFAISALLIALVALFAYRGILFAPAGEPAYPWASDTLGHVLKAEYLQQNLAQGVLYPDFFPDWYMGLQMLRYYPPLPYYLLVALAYVTNNAVTAANWLIALCALAGGLAWLPYRRWMGWAPAVAGGALYIFLPDNVRVALAEGNLPRVLATALLPLAVYCLLRTLEDTGGIRHRLGLALCLAAVVLCHAMMAAIYAVCLALLAGLCWLARTTSLRRAAWAVGSVALGIGLSGWWLLPSFTGGITELDTAAMTEALAVFPLTHYLNPLLRDGNPEAVYLGAALLVLAVAVLLWPSGRDGRTVALTLVGLFGVLITTYGFNEVFNALPFHSLLWPLRFVGIASFMLLLALMWRIRILSKWSPLLALLVVGLLTLDGIGSLSLIHLRPARQDLLAISDDLAARPGWREATLDESRLGSAASYLFTAHGGREQVYGWAYQGARTARNVAALNEALQSGSMGYLLDRLTLYGTDDAVLLNDMLVTPRVAGTLETAGFQPAYTGSTATLYHRASGSDSGPRAVVAHWPALGIGRGAQNLAFLFPRLIVGTSSQVDDYTLDELRRYETVVLSVFGWRDRPTAEALIGQAAEAGVNVVVDLTGGPEDPLAHVPRFLGVWGEHIILAPEPILVQDPGGSYQLLPFGEISALWYTHTPQGMHVKTLQFDYLGEVGTVLGYNEYGEGRVWFVGLNLFYHAALTRDPAAIDLLAEVLRLPPDTPSQYTAVPLTDYTADQAGYRFTYTLETPNALFVPVACHEGTVVTVDGAPATLRSLENLVAFDAPAGEHTVEIQTHPTSIYLLGQVTTGLALLGLFGMFAWERWPFARRASARRPADEAVVAGGKSL
ncbi:MAG: hypothetical protein KKA73_07930 [Chloroflexi bacterium]|nr:hypothetical protein [Chloroflexota bacterium]MBU1747602.1 hypothetical protein [Chloroflexota bacterium]MBU1879655.1 hypothetical protein [Chloroflexota bacterium]